MFALSGGTGMYCFENLVGAGPAGWWFYDSLGWCYHVDTAGPCVWGLLGL